MAALSKTTGNCPQTSQGTPEHWEFIQGEPGVSTWTQILQQCRGKLHICLSFHGKGKQEAKTSLTIQLSPLTLKPFPSYLCLSHGLISFSDSQNRVHKGCPYEMLGVNQLLVSRKALGGIWPCPSSFTPDLVRTPQTQAAASPTRQIKQNPGAPEPQEKHTMQLGWSYPEYCDWKHLERSNFNFSRPASCVFKEPVVFLFWITWQMVSYVLRA